MNNTTNKNLYELMYFSSADQNLSEENIIKILDKARIFNAKNNITGCLVYYKNEFVQILEGEDKIVEELYSRILNDKRHTNTTLLTKSHIKERIFDNWSMAFHKFDETEMKDIGEEKFANNLLTFSQLAKQSTLATILFWNKVRELVNKRAK